MSTVIIPERWERIVELVEMQGQASVEQIAQALGISAPTVRRDLARIQQRGLIKRTRGGAERSATILPGVTLAESRRVNPREKDAIGRATADLIGPGECIMIDGGFTTYQVARHIQAQNIKVVTNSLDVAQVLASRRDVSLVVLGGEVLPESGTTVGPTTVSQLAELVADKVFLGANAVSAEDGLSADIQATAETKKAMIRSSRRVIVAADFTKLGRSALYRVVPVEAISTLVTDDKADEDILAEFRAAGVEVVVAPAGSRHPGGPL